jgi:hypothetical protein
MAGVQLCTSLAKEIGCFRPTAAESEGYVVLRNLAEAGNPFGCIRRKTKGTVRRVYMCRDVFRIALRKQDDYINQLSLAKKRHISQWK